MHIALCIIHALFQLAYRELHKIGITNGCTLTNLFFSINIYEYA